MVTSQRGATRRWALAALGASLAVVVLAIAVFWFPIHPATVPPVGSAGCPTLADYQAAAAQPSSTPAPASFGPVAPDAAPSAGVLSLGAVGILAAPDGSAGALVRVTTVRFCDRLPDLRPELYMRGTPGDYVVMLADVEVKVLKDGSLGNGFFPGTEPVSVQGGVPAPGAHSFPGGINEFASSAGAGFSARGTMAWIVFSNRRGGRVAIEVGRDNAPQFEYIVRDGSTDPIPPDAEPQIGPAATPTTGILEPDSNAVLAKDGARIPIFVGGVSVVDGYPLVMPSPSGDRFLEVLLRFGSPSATYTIDPNDWVLIGPDGTSLARLPDRRTGDGGLALPDFAQPWTAPGVIPPGLPPRLPLYLVVEVPPAGRVTLEYRPHGGPAQVSWIVRDH